MSASPRVPYTRLAAEAFKGLLATSKAVHDSSIDPVLMELVFMRVSQINGCGYCMDMHGTTLRKGGIEPRKLDTLPAWHESRFFDARERAALGWAEALTRLSSAAPSDAAYDALALHFDEKGISDLSMGIAVINAWNRLGAGLLPPLPSGKGSAGRWPAPHDRRAARVVPAAGRLRTIVVLHG